MTTVFISGAIANKPFNGGASWTRLSYVLGFRKLGWDVYFVEKIHPVCCATVDGKPASVEDSANRAYFRRVSEQFGLSRNMALLGPDDRTLEGLSLPDLLDIAGSADLLINISGHLDSPSLLRRIRRKVYVDLDPGFTQMWQGTANSAGLDGHDYYFTVGENLGSHDCLIPVNGIRWRPTRQPIVLDYWPVCNDGYFTRFTTVASWRGPYGPVTHGDRTFGSKVHEFRKYSSIPSETNHEFEIALDIHPDDRKDHDLLCGNSWRLVDPRQVAADPFSFRKYVQTSGAEFSVAQQMYVETNSGWFSDRTVRYLASGKPVLVQDTGFSRNYPVGAGLLTFSTPSEAVAGARDITKHYREHSTSARHIAEEYFDSNRVLSELLSEIA